MSIFRCAPILAGIFCALVSTAAHSQTQTPPPIEPAPSAVPPPANLPLAAAVPKSPAPVPSGVGRNCTRLPLSDIQFGREYTIKVAREKLEEYAQKVAKQKGWKGFTRSAETATCEDYLWLPVGGQEYKCLVTATFCQKP